MEKSFSYRKYYTGVAQFNLRDFMIYQFSEYVGIRPKQASLLRYLDNPYKPLRNFFHTSDLSNFSSQLSGMKRKKMISKYEEINWNMCIANIQESLHIDSYESHLNYIFNGLQLILKESEVIKLLQKQNLCLGFHEDILLELIEKVKNLKEKFYGTNDELLKRYLFASAVLMVITYFTAAGSAFIDTTKYNVSENRHIERIVSDKSTGYRYFFLDGTILVMNKDFEQERKDYIPTKAKITSICNNGHNIIFVCDNGIAYGYYKKYGLCWLITNDAVSVVSDNNGGAFIIKNNLQLLFIDEKGYSQDIELKM